MERDGVRGRGEYEEEEEGRKKGRKEERKKEKNCGEAKVEKAKKEQQEDGKKGEEWTYL